MKTDGCAFCAQAGHRVRGCPAAHEYVRTGRTLVRNDQLILPLGLPIPNDGSGKGLKHGIDTWLAANSVNPGESTVTITQVSAATASQCDPVPLATLSLEIVQSKESDTEEDSDNDSVGGELYDVYEVLAAENTKCAAQPKLQETGPPTNPPTTSNTLPPQYQYQSNVEDQKLTSQLCTWLLEGKLTQTTPAHILATSAPIQKELADQLRPHRVEAGTLEETSNPAKKMPATVLRISAKRSAEFSLPQYHSEKSTCMSTTRQ